MALVDTMCFPPQRWIDFSTMPVQLCTFVPYSIKPSSLTHCRNKFMFCLLSKCLGRWEEMCKKDWALHKPFAVPVAVLKSGLILVDIVILLAGRVLISFSMKSHLRAWPFPVSPLISNSSLHPTNIWLMLNTAAAATTNLTTLFSHRRQ